MAGATSSWHEQLVAMRKRLGITRAELARRAGVPLNTLRRWEDGTRGPTLERLRLVLDALDCPAAEANDILRGAGFPPEHTLFPEDRFPNYYYTVDQLQRVVEDVPWPEFVLNDNQEVLAVNTVIEALWGINFEEESTRRTTPQMNLLSVASNLQFADHLVNWDECVAMLSAVSKGRPRHPHTLEQPDQPDLYFDAVLSEFSKGDSTFLARLIDIFARTPAREAKCRWTYRVVWRDDAFGEMRFIAIVNVANEPAALSFNDWIPLDAESWTALERVKARKP